MTVEVLVELKAKGIDKTFTYNVPSNQPNVEIGKRVLVPFANQKLEGFIMHIDHDKTFDYEIKDIIEVIDEYPVINEEMLELGKYISKKTLCNLISAYQTMLPVALKAHHKVNVNKKYVKFIELNVNHNTIKINNNNQKMIIDLLLENKRVLKKELETISLYTIKTWLDKGILKEINEEEYRLNETSQIEKSSIILTTEQESVIKEISSKLNTFTPYLLEGVTGSGKTEVYMQLIEKVLANGKEAIVLVPEISLTPQLIGVFRKRFGNEIAVLHSGLSTGEKYDEWRKIERKQVKIVVGARSAVFAPFTNIGIIIVDEEHSETYKQENNPKYHAIDLAIIRSKKHKAPLLLGSATPSIESYTRAKTGIYNLLLMKKRINNMLPKVYLVDMKDEQKKGNRVFSSILKEKIIQRLNNDEQIIILLNRRGYSTVMTCHSCGYTLKCPNCDIPLIYHKSDNTTRCHYCGYITKKPTICPMCKSKDINEFGMGTEKLEQIIKETFVNAKVIRMDVDTTTKKGAHEKIISAFKNKEYNILIGTQMIAKGLDFKDVTLVGVINGDASLNIPDFRSSERTFSLLNQVAGRAGRNEKKGEVVIQGFNIDHYSIIKASIHDYEGFYEEEMKVRKLLKYPPYYNLCLIKIKSNDYNKLSDEVKKIHNYLKTKLLDQIILGPSLSTIPKINNIYCMQIIIKYKKKEAIINELEFINNKYKKEIKVKLEIDINPLRL